jgi:hypothetical protein
VVAWYVLGFVPAEDTNKYAEVAVARWRSRSRRQTGRREPVRDLAKGFRESRKLHPEGEGLVSPGEREDYLALASHLIEILKAPPPEAGFARREAQ